MAAYIEPLMCRTNSGPSDACHREHVHWLMMTISKHLPAYFASTVLPCRFSTEIWTDGSAPLRSTWTLPAQGTHHPQ